MSSESSAAAEAVRTVNLDLGNAAELNRIAINAFHIVSVRLTGSHSSRSRKMELQLANGSSISMNFDDPDHAHVVFVEVVATINRTIPDHEATSEVIRATGSYTPG